MTRRSLARWLSPLAIATALLLGLATRPARAQPVPEGEVSKEEAGRSFDGYAATAVLAGLTVFVVAKSARR